MRVVDPGGALYEQQLGQGDACMEVLPSTAGTRPPQTEPDHELTEGQPG